jgi:hypothetical protein
MWRWSNNHIGVQAYCEEMCDGLFCAKFHAMLQKPNASRALRVSDSAVTSLDR